MTYFTRTPKTKSDRSQESLAGMGFALGLGALLIGAAGCGEALEFDPGQSTERRTSLVDTSGSSGSIYAITLVYEAVPLSWTASDLPFTGPAVGIGQPVTNGQTQFQFVYSYPPNNFQLAEAHLVIDTSRDTSDTEGIFIGGGATGNGVFSGNPPGGMPNTTSPKIGYPIYNGNSAGCTVNKFYNDWAIAHYKAGEVNTFDLNIADLLVSGGACPPMPSLDDMLNDDVLPVVTGDDSPVEQAFLVMKGYTIADDLNCSTTPTYTFENVFLHNDGNSTGNPFFNGTARTAYEAHANAYSAPQSTEFYFDAELPRVSTSNITITSALLDLDVIRQATGKAALVVNGVGISETGFSGDGSSPAATSEVEEWITDVSKIAAWEALITPLAADGSTVNSISINLVSLFGAAKTRELLSQGKLNIAMAGSVSTVRLEGPTFFEPTANRAAGHAIGGPELRLAGTYFNQTCLVPNNPDSPLSGAAPGPPTCPESPATAPQITSASAQEITDTSAKIIWLTDELGDSSVEIATSKLEDGTLVNPTTVTASPNNDVVFHEVSLTGLNKYTIYYAKAKSTDPCGNSSESSIITFRTKR